MKENNYNHKLPSIDVLAIEYCQEKMSSIEIALKYNVTSKAVLDKLKRNNIKPRTIKDVHEIKANYIKITNKLEEFINGLLLGDGSMYYTGRKKSCVYGHTDKNKEYLEWLKDKLNLFGIQCLEIKPHTNNTWLLKTKAYRDFISIREKWYPLGKKKIPDIKLTPITLFNWYIGDGSYDKKSKSTKVVICSEFDQIGKIVMAEKLKLINIKNSVYSNCIYIKDKKSFFKYITNHKYKIPDSYKYKF